MLAQTSWSLEPRYCINLALKVRLGLVAGLSKLTLLLLRVEKKLPYRSLSSSQLLSSLCDHSLVSVLVLTEPVFLGYLIDFSLHDGHLFEHRIMRNLLCGRDLRLFLSFRSLLEKFFVLIDE